jgi:MoxR-vWA-beta-propeller ternary system domain bpX2
MEENSSNDLVHLLEINAKHKSLLGQIRHWDNLKLAIDAEHIWVKNFTSAQIDSPVLKAIPFINIYCCKDNLLFPKGSLLPIKKMSTFLWTPIERALPIELVGLNHNFFETDQRQAIKLVPTFEEQVATFLLLDINIAHQYIENASAIRLNTLSWVVVNNEQVLIHGEPLLPIDGKAFWQKGKFIFPLGFSLEFVLLEKTIAQKMDDANDSLIWWMDEVNYTCIDKTMFKALSISSWKQTIKNRFVL